MVARSKAASALEAEAEKRGGSAMTQSLISAIHKKNFEGYFKNNAYLR